MMSAPRNRSNFEDKFAADMMKMLKEGSSHDVEFVLKGGNITANRDILAARSSYFEGMFRNNKFIEGQTKTINMNHIEKEVMQTLIDYLFSGKIDYTKFKLDHLLRLMDLFRFHLLNDELASCDNYVRAQMLNAFPTLDVLKCLPLAKELKLSEFLIANLVARIQVNLSTIVTGCQACLLEQGNSGEPSREEAKVLMDYPYEIFKGIVVTYFGSDIATKIRVFNEWIEANETRLKAQEISVVFKDYRMLVARDVRNNFSSCSKHSWGQKS